VSGSTLLRHEIERWQDGGDSVVWVKVPSVPASGSVTLHMYANNAGAPAPAASFGHEVWTGFEAVFHLDTDGDDSTANALTGSHSTSDTAGVVGGGQLFDGTNDAIVYGDDLDLLRNVGEVTASAFVRPDSVGGSERVVFGLSIASATDTENSRASLVITAESVWNGGGRSADTDAWQGSPTTTGPTQGDPVHVALRIRYGTDEVEVLVDGAALASNATPSFSVATTSNTPARKLVIGAQDDGDTSEWSGLIDELRLSGSWRSDGWLRVEAAAQRANFTTVSNEETP
jgi:hypothetical protein